MARYQGSSWEGSKFKSANNKESRSCRVGSSESELYGNATVFRRFLSGVVRSAKSYFLMRS